MVESCMSDRKSLGCKFESPSNCIKPRIVESVTNLIQPTTALSNTENEYPFSYGDGANLAEIPDECDPDYLA